MKEPLFCLISSVGMGNGICYFCGDNKNVISLNESGCLSSIDLDRYENHVCKRNCELCSELKQKASRILNLKTE